MASQISSGVRGEGRPAIHAVAWTIPRNRLFASLIVMAFANGAFNRIRHDLAADTFATIASLLGISILVWIGLFLAVRLLLQDREEKEASFRDLAVAAFTLLAILAPAAPLSWLALTGLGLHLLISSGGGSPASRAGLLVVAISIPMFWTRLLMAVMGEIILGFDAMLVSLILTSERVGNTIAFQDGWGYFWIAPECSSLANVSLVFVTWAILGNWRDDATKIPLRWCLAASCAVIGINVTRMAVTGFSRAHYELMHGPAGNIVFDILTVLVMTGVLLAGARLAGRHPPPGMRNAAGS